MIKIDMDNGKRYTFDDYTDYFINDEYLVIKKNEQWIGSFVLAHMIGFFVED